jgi:hypothetical protein
MGPRVLVGCSAGWQQSMFWKATQHTVSKHSQLQQRMRAGQRRRTQQQSTTPHTSTQMPTPAQGTGVGTRAHTGHLGGPYLQAQALPLRVQSSLDARPAGGRLKGGRSFHAVCYATRPRHRSKLHSQHFPGLCRSQRYRAQAYAACTSRAAVHDFAKPSHVSGGSDSACVDHCSGKQRRCLNRQEGKRHARRARRSLQPELHRSVDRRLTQQAQGQLRQQPQIDRASVRPYQMERRCLGC